MARIQPRRPRKLSIFLRLSYFLVRRTASRLTGRHLPEAPEPTRLLAHRPLLMMADGFFEGALSWSRSLDPRVKALVRARASALHGCLW